MKLKTVQNNLRGVANFLVRQKCLDICSLVSTQLNNLTNLFVFLNGAVARKVLLECLAYSLNVQIISKTCYGCNTLSSISLLDSNVHLIRSRSGASLGVVKCICEDLQNTAVVSLNSLNCKIAKERQASDQNYIF